MPEIISAKCLGCGNILKVPAALGGKKARCPQCTNTIVIPTAPSDTQFTEFISDADLPEVARDGEKVVREEGDAPIPGQEDEAPEDPSEIRRSKGGTSVRGRNIRPAVPGNVQRSGPQPRVYAGGGGTAARPAPSGGGNTGMILGIGLGVIALVIAARTDWTKPGEAATPTLDAADLRTDQNLDDLFGADEELDARDPIPW